jgi:hypothetical protein
MAKTYYKYADRLAESQIDWSEIGKDLSSALKQELAVREATINANQEATRQTTQKISEAPKGDYDLENQRMSEFADNVTKYSQTINSLWKSGQLSTKELTAGRQNLLDGIDAAYSLSKEYQDEYKKTMERAQSQDPATRSQTLEQWMKSSVEGYGNLQNTQYYIDPTSGVVNLANVKREKVDGKDVVTMGDSFMSINDARNRLKQEYNYWDVDNATKGVVDQLGENVQDIRKMGGPSRAGQILSISDIRLRTDLSEKDKEALSLFDKSLNTRIDGMAAQWTNVTSYLTENLRVDPKTGLAYEFTENPSEQASNVILLKRDELGRTYADFESATGKEQLNTFKDSVRDKILTEIDTKREIDTYTEPEPNYGSGSGSGSGNKRKTNSLGITVYENSNNALRTGNLKNLDTKKAKYVFEPSGKKKKDKSGKEVKTTKNSILIYELDDLGDYALDANGKKKVKRIYSADQLAAYVKGVDQSKVIPTELYNEGKDDWSYLNEGNYLKGAGYTKEEMSGSVYTSKGKEGELD